MSSKIRYLLTIIVTALVTFTLSFVWFVPKGVPSSERALYNKLSTVKNYIDSRYIGEYDSSNLADGAAEGLLSSLGDPYADYFSQEEMKDLMQSLEGSYTGIGVVVYVDTLDNLLTVLAPYDDTPASRAGLLPGDKILQVDSIAVTGANYNDAINYMKGYAKESQKSDELTLTISRNGGEPFSVKLKREVISLKTVKYEQMDNIACIRLSGFDESTPAQFKEALNSIDRNKTSGLVLDLRDNPGGLLESAVAICDELVPEGLIVYVEDKNGRQRKYNADELYNDIPMVVLINSNSASASEIVAGALKDRERAKLVGVKSFGKGVAQSIIPLRDGTALKLTTEKYYIPSGVCIDQTGIAPHIEVNLPSELSTYYASSLSLDEDTQLQEAIKLLN